MSAEEDATVREPLDLIRLSMEERIYGFIITTRHWCSNVLAASSSSNAATAKTQSKLTLVYLKECNLYIYSSTLKSLRDGHSPYGDQILWKFCEQFGDIEFPHLSGACIIGYGSPAVELLTRYFEGQISPILEADNEADVEHSPIRVTEAAEALF
ncbi:hypothetical protein F2Q69_00012346 [Brassica cretica]|uniref:N-acetyltransferase domain-containing protein n=1 Tax=Brassica cretica TaxID=69181 RepID=A0A8S9R8B4_BRACR|nr:hypothetical protein F2Q69_00012346 [Brassica cretica]